VNRSGSAHNAWSVKTRPPNSFQNPGIPFGVLGDGGRTAQDGLRGVLPDGSPPALGELIGTLALAGCSASGVGFNRNLGDGNR
jgi:hypothetical protein